MIIGITGGIGSGKSTVCNILKEYNFEVIDADKVARDIVQKGSKTLDKLAEAFGKGILNQQGNLDRKKLGNIVFNNSEKLNILNNITHPEVAKELNKLIKEIPSKNIALEVVIPNKECFFDIVDTVWSVVSQKELRIKRIMQRNNISEEEAISRINSQKNDNYYIEIADHIIYNNKDIISVKGQIKNILEGNFE